MARNIAFRRGESGIVEVEVVVVEEPEGGGVEVEGAPS